MGYADVDLMLDSIGNSKLAEWIAYRQIEVEEEKEAQKSSDGRVTNTISL